MHDEYARGRNQRGNRKPTPLSDLDPELTEVSRKTIGCAIQVHMALGPGHAPDIYLTALQAELAAEGVGSTSNKTFQVHHRDQVVGETIADLEIDSRFLLKVLAAPKDIGYERSELRAQLRAADMELGLIMNFAERRMTDGLVRVLNPNKLNAMRAEAQEHEDEDIEEYEDDDHNEDAQSVDAHSEDTQDVDEDKPMAAPPEVGG